MQADSTTAKHTRTLLARTPLTVFVIVPLDEKICDRLATFLPDGCHGMSRSSISRGI
jgi:hypothetical protein